MSKLQNSARALLVLVVLSGLGVGVTSSAAASCAHHDSGPLTRPIVLDYMARVDQVVAQRSDVMLHPDDVGFLERVINRVYECRPDLQDHAKNALSVEHRNIQRMFNRLDQQACYYTMPNVLADFIVKVVRYTHECFPE